MGTSILAAYVTTGVLECDETLLVLLNLNAAVLVQMPCPSHHRGARMAQYRSSFAEGKVHLDCTYSSRW